MPLFPLFQEAILKSIIKWLIQKCLSSIYIKKRIGGEPSSAETFKNSLENMSYEVEKRKLLLKFCNKGARPSRVSVVSGKPVEETVKVRITTRLSSNQLYPPLLYYLPSPIWLCSIWELRYLCSLSWEEMGSVLETRGWQIVMVLLQKSKIFKLG